MHKHHISLSAFPAAQTCTCNVSKTVSALRPCHDTRLHATKQNVLLPQVCLCMSDCLSSRLYVYLYVSGYLYIRSLPVCMHTQTPDHCLHCFFFVWGLGACERSDVTDVISASTGRQSVASVHQVQILGDPCLMTGRACSHPVSCALSILSVLEHACFMLQGGACGAVA